MRAGLGNRREMVYSRGDAAADKLGEVPRVAQQLPAHHGLKLLCIEFPRRP